MKPSATSNGKGIVLCVLISSLLPCTSEANISIVGTVAHRQRRIIQFTCSFPKIAVRGRSLALRRRVYTDTIFRTMTITNKTQVSNFFQGSTSITAFTLNGSVTFTFRRASCLDAGQYECRAVFIRGSVPFDSDEVADVATLEMLPSSARLISQPQFLDFRHMVPGTLIKLQCSVFSTLSLQDGWVWETARLPHNNWSRVPDRLWTQELVPDFAKRCYVPWKSTLTLPVTQDDVDQIFRCYLRYRFRNMTFKTPFAVYTFKDHQMVNTPNQAMLTVLAMGFGSGIVILGSIMMFRSFSTHFPQECFQAVAHARRLCCRQTSWRLRQSRFHAADSLRTIELTDEHNSPVPSTTPGGTNSGQDKPESSPKDVIADTQSRDMQSENDSPGAEDDYCQDMERPEVEEGKVELVLEPLEPSSVTLMFSMSPSTTTCVGIASPSTIYVPSVLFSYPASTNNASIPATVASRAVKTTSENCMCTVSLSTATSNCNAPISSTTASCVDIVQPQHPKHCVTMSKTVPASAVSASSATTYVCTMPLPATSSMNGASVSPAPVTSAPQTSSETCISTTKSSGTSLAYDASISKTVLPRRVQTPSETCTAGVSSSSTVLEKDDK